MQNNLTFFQNIYLLMKIIHFMLKFYFVIKKKVCIDFDLNKTRNNKNIIYTSKNIILYIICMQVNTLNLHGDMLNCLRKYCRSQ